MLGQSVAGQTGRDGLVPLAGSDLGFGRAQGRHVGGGEAVQKSHQGRRSGGARILA